MLKKGEICFHIRNDFLLLSMIWNDKKLVKIVSSVHTADIEKIDIWKKK